MLEIEINGFDESAWRAICEKVTKETDKMNWGGETVYINHFSASIDEALTKLPEAQHEVALKIAREYNYATPSEIADDMNRNREHGYCIHGIENFYCPAGCGESEN